MITKREYSAVDSAPVVLYSKRDTDDTKSFAVMAHPVHDQRIIDKTDPNNITITYKLNGATVSTRTIAIVGEVTTVSITYA